MSSSNTTVSIGTAPSLESHHMLAPIPFGKTTIIGGMRPCAIAVPYQLLSHGIPAIGLPEPCR